MDGKDTEVGDFNMSDWLVGVDDDDKTSLSTAPGTGTVAKGSEQEAATHARSPLTSKAGVKKVQSHARSKSHLSLTALTAAQELFESDSAPASRDGASHSSSREDEADLRTCEAHTSAFFGYDPSEDPRQAETAETYVINPTAYLTG